MSDHSLSFFDLEKVEGWSSAWQSQDKKDVEKYLFENGMDTSQPYEIRVCMHRTLCNKVEYGPRFEGTERNCKEWLASGAASMDAIISSSSDPFLRGELLGKCRTGCAADMSWDESLQTECKGKKKAIGVGVHPVDLKIKEVNKNISEE